MMRLRWRRWRRRLRQTGQRGDGMSTGLTWAIVRRCFGNGIVSVLSRSLRWHRSIHHGILTWWRRKGGTASQARRSGVVRRIGGTGHHRVSWNVHSPDRFTSISPEMFPSRSTTSPRCSSNLAMRGKDQEETYPYPGYPLGGSAPLLGPGGQPSGLLPLMMESQMFVSAPLGVLNLLDRGTEEVAGRASTVKREEQVQDRWTSEGGREGGMGGVGVCALRLRPAEGSAGTDIPHRHVWRCDGRRCPILWTRLQKMGQRRPSQPINLRPRRYDLDFKRS